MKKSGLILLFISIAAALAACSPVKDSLIGQYQLDRFMTYRVKPGQVSPKTSILISTPVAVASYQTEQMLYIKKPYTLSPFARHAWVSPPAEMLYPLLMQSLQASGFFYAVASSPYPQLANYRLDTQLLKLHQNFLKKPSQIELAVKVVLTQIDSNQVISSRIIAENVTSPMESPYGGVSAANRATEALTRKITEFAIHYIKADLGKTQN